MKIDRRVTRLMTTLIVLVTFCRLAIGSDEFRKELLEAATPEWRHLRELFAGCEGNSETTETVSPLSAAGEPQITRKSCTFKLRNGLELVERSASEIISGSQRSAFDQDEVVVCIGPSNSFVLKRRLGSKAWLIVSTGNKPTEGIRRSTEQYWAEYLLAPCSSGGVPFDELIAKAGFHIESLQSITLNDVELRKVRFTYTPTADEIKGHSLSQPLWALRSGTFTFCPRLHWALVASELVISTSEQTLGTESTKVYYDTSKDGVAVPLKVVRTTVSSNVNCESVARFDRIAFRQIPEAEFTLPAYGLPEMAIVPHVNRTRLWIILLNVAFFCAFGIMLLYKRFTRSKKAS